MFRPLYSLFFYLLIPFALLRLLLRSVKSPEYRRRWKERFGFFQLPQDWNYRERPIWIHAVSVGETVASVPLIKLLQERYPQTRLLVTTMTPTGSERVRALFGDSVFHVYLPYDLPGAMQRFIGSVNPRLLIIMETELWPNLLACCSRAGCRTLLANARLSEKSARGYSRISKLTRGMLENLHCLAVQTRADGDRFIRLGAMAERVAVMGNLKFDSEPPTLLEAQPSVFDQISQLDRKVLIAASTREGEDEKVLTAFKQCLEHEQDLLLVLVPRHPERFNSAELLCRQRDLSVVRRSSNEFLDPTTQVFLGDSMGEIWHYYQLADVAFVGGSLVDTGCHNVLEPAAIGLPVVIGPSRFNFQAVCDLLEESGGLIVVADEQTLAKQVVQLLQDSQQRSSMGAAAKRTFDANRGSLQRLATLIETQLAAG